jgi:hypothetical protein
MGINPGWFELLFELADSDLIKPGDPMLDIGASELFCAENPQCLNTFLQFFGAAPYEDEELRRMANRAFAAPLFERAGFRYCAIDYANFPGILRLDLNRHALPAEHHGAYLFVVNSGTSEHILNQYNVFEVIHDACAVGGVMYHGVPGWGDYQHGIIEYSPKFFWSLAEANDYQIIKFWGWSSQDVRALSEDFLSKIPFNCTPRSSIAWLHIVLRKRSPLPFRGLNDPAFTAAATSPS